MRVMFVLFSLLSVSACGAPTAASRDGVTPEAHAGSGGAMKPPGDATIGDRAMCLVSNEEFTISSASPKVEYKGKTYYFCCAGCDTKFAADPEKYLKKSGT